MSNLSSTQESEGQETYAAIDLGSNSFHMAIATPEGRAIRMLDSLREPVRLGAGLDAKKRIKTKTEKLALDTLNKFAERLRGIPRENIRMVGTSTLRRASNSKQFANKAFEILGKRIEIISGREEARLIFESVAHALPLNNDKRLVIDIGGGSTELVTGTGVSPVLMESITMGCVSSSNDWFDGSEISQDNFRTAMLHAQLELQPLALSFARAGWDAVYGCSGTIKATARVLHELDIEKVEGLITWSGLKALQKMLIKAGKIEKLRLESISKDRMQVIVGGISILMGIMKTLDIKEVQVSQVALREGLIFDMIGKSRHADIQSHTVNNIARRFQVDEAQSTRVETLALELHTLAAKPWKIDSPVDANLLAWAARLHEIGLSVAHSGYHKHGAYLLEHADMMGFTQSEQTALALMVRYHRRKFDVEGFDILPRPDQENVLKLTALLRLAVLVNRSRSDFEYPVQNHTFKSDKIIFQTDETWRESHPLTLTNLEGEARHMDNAGIDLKIDT